MEKRQVNLTIAEARQILRQYFPLLQEKYQIRSLGLFGSYVRHEQRQDSDLDILVTFQETPGLLQFIALETYLSELLDVQVDLVMRDALKPHLGQRILQEVIPV